LKGIVARSRLHSEHQRLRAQPNTLRHLSETSKGNLDLKIRLFRRFRVRVDKHPFRTDIPCKASPTARHTFVNPLEVHDCSDTVAGLLSAFQTTLFLSRIYRSPIGPCVALPARPNPFLWARKRYSGMPLTARGESSQLVARKKHEALQPQPWRFPDEKLPRCTARRRRGLS